MLQGLQRGGREGGSEEAPTPTDSTAHLAGGSRRCSACSKATAKGRTRGWLQQLAPSKCQLPRLLDSDGYACHRDPCLSSPRSRSTEPCPPRGWQSCCSCRCWQAGRDQQCWDASTRWPAGAAGGGLAPRASHSPAPMGSKAHPAWRPARGPTLSRWQRCPEEHLHSSSALKQLYPEVHPHLLTFFLTARGCSVARITRSFCSAPPSIASIWTLGLLQGKKQRAGHQQSGAQQGGTDSRSVWGSTPQWTRTSVNPARPQSKPLQLPPTTVCSYGEGAKPCRPSQTQHMTDAA